MSLALAWRLRFPIAVLVLAASAALWYRSTVRNAEERGRLAAQVAVLDSTIAEVSARKARVDTVWRADSVSFAAWDTVYVHTTDTIRVDNTLYVNKAVADSTVNAARKACASCARSLAVSDSLLRLERARADKADGAASVAVRDARRDKVTWGVVGYALGALSALFAR